VLFLSLRLPLELIRAKEIPCQKSQWRFLPVLKRVTPQGGFGHDDYSPDRTITLHNRHPGNKGTVSREMWTIRRSVARPFSGDELQNSSERPEPAIAIG
jgi:hypothetical protein